MPRTFSFPSPARAGERAGKTRPDRNDVLRLARTRRDLVMRCVSMCLDVPMRTMMRPGRGRAREVLARHICMYLLHVVFSLPPGVIGCLFRKDRTTVAHACRRIEDRREKAAFDAFLHALEVAAGALDTAARIRTKHELYELVEMDSLMETGRREAC